TEGAILSGFSWSEEPRQVRSVVIRAASQGTSCQRLRRLQVVQERAWPIALDQPNVLSILIVTKYSLTHEGWNVGPRWRRGSVRRPEGRTRLIGKRAFDDSH